jgi:shikimate kinase
VAGTRQDRRIALVGMMGSGKTTVGRALAEALGEPYIDNDDLVEVATGGTSPELLAAGGTPAVRDAEAEALRVGLSGRIGARAVLGVAAGTILDPDLRELLRERSVVVWLRARPETLARRIAADPTGGTHRPWHEAGSMTAEVWLRREAEARAPFYTEVADVIVDVDDDEGQDRPIVDIVAEIGDGLDRLDAGAD